MSDRNAKEYQQQSPAAVCSATLLEPTEVPGAHVWNHGTGSALVDASGKPVTVETYLGSAPLRNDLETRPGPGNTKLTYMSGNLVARTLNEAFGHDGWSLSVISNTKDSVINLNEKEPNRPPKWQVSYIAHVRVTLTSNGAFREDFGFSDNIDRSIVSATSNAAKGAVTDGMKRAARHFGEKLGNAITGKFKINQAPIHLSHAIHDYQMAQLQVQNKFFDKEPLPLPKMPMAKQTAAQTHQNQQHRKPLPSVRPEATTAASYHTKPAAAAPPLSSTNNAPPMSRSNNPNVNGAISSSSNIYKQASRSMVPPENVANQASIPSMRGGSASTVGVNTSTDGTMKPQARDVRDVDDTRRHSTGNSAVDRDMQNHNHAHKNRLSDTAAVRDSMPSSLEHAVQPYPPVEPKTPSQGLQAIFGDLSEGAREEEYIPNQYLKRPPTAAGYRPSNGAHAGANKKPRIMGAVGGTGNPYQKTRH